MIVVYNADERFAGVFATSAVGMADYAQNTSFRTQLDLPKEGIYYNSDLPVKHRLKKREEICKMKVRGGYYLNAVKTAMAFSILACLGFRKEAA